ncbi:DUF4276 family protein [Calothrix rhizosoleniae]|uniref:DUF4276 family protein n=1 Tax=Calothrix rhizosoleniae TaxID=888997 RepID=UPI000B49CD04|nr:DUF4276 family protein [Calothrix rhizosoleniae]
MVKAIRIYIEGGGDGKNTKTPIRQGFSRFFQELGQLARSKKIKWNIIICGSRNDAFRDFNNALIDHPDAFNILLVDAEAPVVENSPWEHLKIRDNWIPPAIDKSHSHLMVQTMEAWMIADIDALKKFYGQEFKENAIPKTKDVEKIDKDTLASSLKKATCSTTKGEYQKIKHASKLLEILDTDKVRQASSHCDNLFTTLERKIT